MEESYTVIVLDLLSCNLSTSGYSQYFDANFYVLEVSFGLDNSALISSSYYFYNYSLFS